MLTNLRMRLFLIRHGQTEYNADARVQGSSDVPLNAVGRAQAEALAPRLARLVLAEPLDGIWSSPLGRALETARIALPAAERGRLETDPRLREMYEGAWEGLTREELEARFPDSRRAWARDPASFVPPGGHESLMDVQGRMIDFVRAREAESAEGAFLVFGHGFATLSLLCWILDLPLASFRRLWIDSTGMSEVRIEGERRWLVRLNDCAHLEGVELPPARSALRD